jgi:hypothetical protein
VLVISPGGYQPRDESHAVTLGRPTRLRGERVLHLNVTQQYRIVEAEGERGPWKVTTTSYSYEILNEDQSEFLIYHWHPEGLSPESRPHLHIGGAHRKTHVPTGRVAIEDVLRMCIRDLGVDETRDDWAAVLDEAQAAFATWRTWG